MRTILVTMIYVNKHDSRIYPGNRHKDICQGTSVTRPIQKKICQLIYTIKSDVLAL